MPVNKNAFLRYKVLDACFRNPGRLYTLDDLVKACNTYLMEVVPDSGGIRRRQVFDDIKFMESADGWQIPLVKWRSGRKMYYRYADLSFSIMSNTLSDLEISQLKSAIDVIAQFRGMPQFEWIQDLLPKLTRNLIFEDAPGAIIEFDHNQYLRGLDFLGTLYNAVFYKKVLSIRYHPFDFEAPYDTFLHPYYLKQYNNRWYVYGYNPENGRSDWMLALDRILSIEEVLMEYRPNGEVDWRQYFDDIIGVTKPADRSPERVVLRFFGKTCHYIVTKPLHGSQKSKWIRSDVLEVHLEVIPNYELESTILSFVGFVQVVEPEHLSKTIQARLQAGLDGSAAT